MINGSATSTSSGLVYVVCCVAGASARASAGAASSINRHSQRALRPINDSARISGTTVTLHILLGPARGDESENTLVLPFPIACDVQSRLNHSEIQWMAHLDPIAAPLAAPASLLRAASDHSVLQMIWRQKRVIVYSTLICTVLSFLYLLV